MDDISPLTSKSCANANTKHAYPAAEEARPAAVGKLLVEHM
jgi:hypothetical protein